MATKNDVRTELLEATGIKPKKGETEAALSTRVGAYIDGKMDEETYGNLSAAAQKWYEKLCAVEEGEEAPEMPAGKETPAAKKAAGKKAPAKKAAGKTAAAKKAPAKKAAAKTNGEAREPRQSGFRTALAVLAANPELSLEQVQARLAKKGVEFSESTLRVVHSSARTMIDVMRESGWKQP